MKEVLNLHIGQAGVQIGSALWELFCVEHGISETGWPSGSSDRHFNECVEAYFTSADGRFVPRSVFIDLESTVVDEIRIGSFRDLYHPDRLITGLEDAASNFARGFFTIGKLLIGRIANENRKISEACEMLQAIMIYRSFGGGTGAGLTSALFDVLAEYPKTPKIDIPIFPSPAFCSSTVEPYNSLLAQHFSMEDTDLSLLFDNEALYGICNKYLYQKFPTITMINQLIVQVLASVTASLRFENTLYCDVSVLQVNLVPYPRIHYPLCNYAPVAGATRSNHEKLTADNLTRSVFEKENQMVKIDLSLGKLMSCALVYRGPISPYDVYQALSNIKRDKSLDFVEWCPTGFKVGLNLCPPMRIPGSHLAPTDKNVSMLTNSSAIGQAFQRLAHKFYLLYAKRSFLHWFIGEGMEEIEFTESIFNITALVKDYEEVSKDSVQANVMERPENKISKKSSEKESRKSMSK